MKIAGVSTLGYDPKPELDEWRGTPIPPVHHPLTRTPERWRIADSVWWNGPQWTVLRNSSMYLWHVMDYGSDEDIAYTRQDLQPGVWHRALEEARTGLLSKGSYVLWSLVFDRMAIGTICDWPDTAHRLDYRMLANESRERLYERHWQRRNLS